MLSMTSKMPTIIITGASGFVGSELVTYFRLKGWQVRALVRNPATYPSHQNVQAYAYDLDQAIDDAAFEAADYLIHAAYVKDSRQQHDSFAVNVGAAKRLLAVSRAHKLKRTIFISSMSAHPDAVSGYGKQKCAIEKLFSRPEDSIVRCGLVIGNGGLIKNIVQFMRSKHAAPLIDGGRQPLQVLAIYDLARIIDRIIDKKLAGSFQVAHPNVYSYREFYQTIIADLRLKAIVVPVPFFVPLFAIRLVNWLHLPLSVTEDNLWGLRKLQAFETLPDLQKLGLHIDDLYAILHNPAITAYL
jgi:nucleoside-diphosphate-sugar epimerase